MKIGIITGVLLAVIALVVCLVPLKEVTYAVPVDYQDIESYYENEPYQDTEIYSTREPLDYEVESFVRQVKGTETLATNILGRETQQTKIAYLDVACVKVTNTDTVPGTFKVLISVKEPTFGWQSPFPEGNLDMFPNKTLNLQPSQTGLAQCAADELGDWTYTVSPSTKTIEQQRLVTKHRMVEKERTVTKHRLETHYKKVTLLDYLLHVPKS